MNNDFPPEQMLEQVREKVLDTVIDQFGATDARYSTLYRALDAITQAALAHGKAIGATAWDFEYRILTPGIDMIETLRIGVQADKTPDAEIVNLWHHRTELFDLVRARKTPAMYRSTIEAATGRYLALPYREQSIDRLLADVLVALEAAQFADQMLNEIVHPALGEPTSPILRKHPFRVYLKGLSVNLGTMLAIVAGMVGLGVYGIVGQGWVLGISLGVIIIIGLLVVLMTVTLPMRWRKHAAARDKVVMLMQEMQRTYAELESSGPISARRLLERLRDSDAKGVTWPAPLYALLDDVIAGSGRL